MKWVEILLWIWSREWALDCLVESNWLGAVFHVGASRQSSTAVIKPANVLALSKSPGSFLRICNSSASGRLYFEAVKACEAEGREGIGGWWAGMGSSRGLESAGVVHHCLQKRREMSLLLCSAVSMQLTCEVEGGVEDVVVVVVESCCRGESGERRGEER